MDAVLFADDEQSTDVNVMKLLPSVGRGMKLPPLSDVSLPKAYYDELPPHLHTLSNSGIGRGHQLQELVGDNSNLERPGERCVNNTESEVESQDEFPSADREDVTLHEKPASPPPASKTSLKSLASQFATMK